MANRSKKQIVLDNLDKIKDWLGEGYTVDSIAKALNVSRPTLYKYANLDNLYTVKNAREPAIKELENSMFKSACGFERAYIRHEKVKRIEYDPNGKKIKEWEDIVEVTETKYFPPDTVAGIFLLKNWAGYANEPKAIELKDREVDIKEKQAW